MHDIIAIAKKQGVVDIGQINKQQRAALNNAVKDGVLWKTTTYEFPIPKNMWVAMPPGKV